MFMFVFVLCYLCLLVSSCSVYGIGLLDKNKTASNNKKVVVWLNDINIENCDKPVGIQ